MASAIAALPYVLIAFLAIVLLQQSKQLGKHNMDLSALSTAVSNLQTAAKSATDKIAALESAAKEDPRVAAEVADLAAKVQSAADALNAASAPPAPPAPPAS